MKKKTSVKKVLILELIVFVIMFIFNMITVAGIDGVLLTERYTDLPSLLIIILFISLSLMVSGLGKDFLNIFKIGKETLTIKQLKRSLEAVCYVQKVALSGAGVFFVISLMVIFAVLSDAAITVFCANIAVALIILLYAIVIQIFLAPLKAIVQNEITEAMDIEDEEA